MKTARSLIGLSLVVQVCVEVVGCSADTPAVNTELPLVPNSQPLTDTDPDPDTVAVRLVAAEGKQRYLPDGRADVWGYRDGALPKSEVRVPGPMLEVEQGQKVIVHFTNELPETTTVHWHGLRVPNHADGTPSAQVEVAPGESFDYEFVAKDAGTFWYHPHVHSDVQIERGLYAPIVVHGDALEDIPDISADRMFVLDDIKLNADGSLAQDTTQLDVMLGRQGNVLLVNGVRNGRIRAKAGTRERWRFVNVANGRYFNLRLPGQKLRIIGWDGGLLAEPYEAKSLLIVPGERYELLVDIPDAQGSAARLQTIYYDRGHEIPDPGPQTLFTLDVAASDATRAMLPDAWGTAVELDVPQDARERSFELSEQMPEGGGFATFQINGHAFPDVPVVEGRTGQVEVFRIYNHSEMDHPFHLHGMFFRVLDLDGEAPAHDGWKDTVNVPQESTLRFAVRYEEPGRWMYHCHILEHADRGMMGELKLLPDDENTE